MIMKCCVLFNLDQWEGKQKTDTVVTTMFIILKSRFQKDSHQ